MKSFLQIGVNLSLLFALVACSWSSWSQANELIQKAKNSSQVIKIAQNEANSSGDTDLLKLIAALNDASDDSVKDKLLTDVKQYVAAATLREQVSGSPTAVDKAIEIKSRPEYNIRRESSASTWFSEMMKRLKRNQSESNETQMPNMNIEGGAQIFQYILQGILILLCVVAAGFLIYFLTKIRFAFKNRGGKRKGKGGILDVGEELLTEDEYLVLADKLIAEGKFREACRALYIASLLRISDLRIARFEPYETNWEHLIRFEMSPMPKGDVNFRTTTKAFDMAWYGYRAKSAEDVNIFRQTYIELKNLAEVKAA